MINKIAVCGVGRLGLPLALNLERRSRVEVIGYDVNVKYVADLNSRTFESDEPQVADLLQQSSIVFHDVIDAVLAVDFAVICVRTDSVASGEYDLAQLWRFMDELTGALDQGTARQLRALAVNCNVNPGTSSRIATLLERFGIEVYFWPEWVKQGSVVEDQLNPPVTVLGMQPNYLMHKDVLSVIQSLDTRSPNSQTRVLGLMEAEICKISLNCFLTLKISFANMIGNLVDELGLDASAVLEALSNDPRVGRAFIQPGFGYGGPCLPRDNRALLAFASKFGVDMPLCSAADEVNESRHRQISKTAVRLYNQQARVPEVDTLSYKSGIPIFTESQQLRFVVGISEMGIPVRIKDTASLKFLEADLTSKFILKFK